MAVIFYAEMIGFFCLIIGGMAGICCLLGAVTYRDMNLFLKLFLVLGGVLVVFFLRLYFVPNGEINSRQYSGLAGLIQLLFFITNVIATLYFIKILKKLLSSK